MPVIFLGIRQPQGQKVTKPLKTRKTIHNGQSLQKVSQRSLATGDLATTRATISAESYENIPTAHAN